MGADAVTFNDFFAITTSDTVDIPDRHVAMYVGGAGNLQVVNGAGVVTTFAVIAGQVLPIRARRINATSTTATGLVGLKQV
jgi:hypothetical protein